MNNTIELRFGAMSPTLKEQLAGQLLKLDKARMIRFQEIADAITLLHVCGYITDQSASKARRTLAKEISEEAVRVKVRPL